MKPAWDFPRHVLKGEQGRKMKSAYEIAMEKLQQESPDIKLTDEQRAELQSRLDDLHADLSGI